MFLTQEEITAIRKNIAQCDTDIKTLEAKKGKLRQRLIENNFAIVDAKFPNLVNGKAYNVTRKKRDWWTKEAEIVTEKLFYHSRHLCAYGDSTKLTNIKYEFYLTKKDGTKGKRTTEFWFEDLIAINEVTE